MKLTVSLDTITCNHPPRRARRKPPYLWTVFFKLDGSGLSLSPEFELKGEVQFHFTHGSHGNLGTVTVGEAVPISSYLGHWETSLEPIPVPFFDYEMPGILGVVAVLMQENNVSDIGAEAGHQALNDFVQEAIQESIANFSVKLIDVENIQPSLKRYFADQVDRLAEGIESRVRQAVVKSQSWSQNLWSLIDQDELIGYRVWDLMASEIPTDETVELVQNWTSQSLGDWTLEGQVVAT